jgi:hypothetical protein
MITDIVLNILIIRKWGKGGGLCIVSLYIKKCVVKMFIKNRGWYEYVLFFFK